jgi:tetratricopeptide (TPR) repeat protein
MLPDPDQARDLDDLAERLRLLKAWAGGPSYEIIKDRVNTAWTTAGRPAGELARKSTVADCFRPGRRRVNADLIVEIVRALHPEAGYVERWRQTLRAIGGELEAVAQVRVQASLPGTEGFTGRVAELARLRDGGTIQGMAGVGKTRLAIQAARALGGDHVLFVDLRGFHPDPAQPPADPSAVLDGFLRLLGVPGQAVPHSFEARAELYQKRLAGRRVVVVLDNAATAEQARPLLPAAASCVALVTSRRALSDLPLAAHVELSRFTPAEALSYLESAGSGPADTVAAERIALRCGHLPLALDLVATHIRNTPGWTLADHADRLDERHHERRLDSAVELALNLSYQGLGEGPRRLLRLAAVHPGQDIEAHAAAALLGSSVPIGLELLSELRGEHLLEEAAPGRYIFHDLVRAYAIGRSRDEDRPADRHAALVRLADHYTASSAAAMDVLVPAERHQRPIIAYDRTFDAEAARQWLDTELPTLMSVAQHGPPEHAVLLSATLFRHLTRGHLAEAMILHDRAQRAAAEVGDLVGQGHALTALGVTHMLQGHVAEATDHCERGLALFRKAGDAAGAARVLNNLGSLADWAGDYDRGAARFEEALELYRELDDLSGLGRVLNGLGDNRGRQGDYARAIEIYAEALPICRRNNDPITEGTVLGSLAHVEILAGSYESAAEHYAEAVQIYRRTGDRSNEAGAHNGLGRLNLRLGRYAEATRLFEDLLAIVAETGLEVGRMWAYNGLGEVAQATGRFAEAAEHHDAAYAIALAAGESLEQERAQAGREKARSSLSRSSG